MRENINEMRGYLNYGDTQNARTLKLEGHPKCKDSCMGYPESMGILKLEGYQRDIFRGYLDDCRTVGSGSFGVQVSSSLLAGYYFSLFIKCDSRRN